MQGLLLPSYSKSSPWLAFNPIPAARSPSPTSSMEAFTKPSKVLDKGKKKGREKKLNSKMLKARKECEILELARKAHKESTPSLLTLDDVFELQILAQNKALDARWMTVEAGFKVHLARRATTEEAASRLMESAARLTGAAQRSRTEASEIQWEAEWATENLAKERISVS